MSRPSAVHGVGRSGLRDTVCDPAHARTVAWPAATRSVALLLWVTLLCVGPGWAQETTSGAITGRVVDPQGAAVPGAVVTVTSDEADVNVRKEGGTLYINVNQKEDEMAKVEVTMPMELMSAFTFNEENTLDIAALLQSLDKLPNGELVRVTSNEANVRVWIE